MNAADQAILESQMGFGEQILSLAEQNCALYILFNQLSQIPSCLSSTLSDWGYLQNVANVWETLLDVGLSLVLLHVRMDITQHARLV